MAKSETLNLLTHGTPTPPQLFLPERRKIEPLVQAKTLASLPPPLDAIPPANSAPCTVFHIRMPIKEQTSSASIDLVVLNLSDSTNILQNARQVDRGLQRIAQYERLINLIAEFEGKLRRGLKPSYSLGNQNGYSFLATPEFINKLKHVAASFYAQELAQESFTKELAKGVMSRTVLDEEAVVLEAERVIFDHPKEKVEPKKAVFETAEERARLDSPSQETAEFFEELWNRPF